jgi:hypothetical protein
MDCVTVFVRGVNVYDVKDAAFEAIPLAYTLDVVPKKVVFPVNNRAILVGEPFMKPDAHDHVNLATIVDDCKRLDCVVLMTDDVYEPADPDNANPDAVDKIQPPIVHGEGA